MKTKLLFSLTLLLILLTACADRQTSSSNSEEEVAEVKSDQHRSSESEGDEEVDASFSGNEVSVKTGRSHSSEESLMTRVEEEIFNGSAPGSLELIEEEIPPAVKFNGDQCVSVDIPHDITVDLWDGEQAHYKVSNKEVDSLCEATFRQTHSTNTADMDKEVEAKKPSSDSDETADTDLMTEVESLFGNSIPGTLELIEEGSAVTYQGDECVVLDISDNLTADVWNGEEVSTVSGGHASTVCEATIRWNN